MWNWLKSAFSFVSSLAGKVLGKSGERALVNSTCDGAITAVENITERLLADQISVDTWLKECRLALKNAYIQQYLLGIGGQSQLTFRDYGSIGGMLGEQYKYLQNFAREIAAGNLTPGQIRMRIAMYANSAGEAYNRGRVRAHGIPEGKIPAWPRSGDTPCKTNCRCDFDIHENKDRWELFWMLGAAENHCPVCLERSRKWNPYVIEKE